MSTLCSASVAPTAGHQATSPCRLQPSAPLSLLSVLTSRRCWSSPSAGGLGAASPPGCYGLTTPPSSSAPPLRYEGAATGSGSDRPSGDLAAELVLDMDADDLLEAGVGLEAELERPRGLKLARPAGDDALHERIGHAADARHHLVASHFPECRDLLADRDGEPGHGERAAPAEAGKIQQRGMQHKAHRLTRRSVPMHHALGDGKHGFFARQRLAHDVGEEAR